jgi:hypothetical protein
VLISVFTAPQRWQNVAIAGIGAVAMNLLSAQLSFAAFKLPPIDSGEFEMNPWILF